MDRLVKSILAVAAIAGAGLAATLTADAQRIGTQKWAGDAETLVHNASTAIECRGCPWHGAQCTPRAKNYRTCDHRCERPKCSNDKRYDNCSERCIPLASPAPPPGQRPGGSAGPPPHRPPQPQTGYAAVAVDGRGAWGASLGLGTAEGARADAVSRCGGKCRVTMTGRGRCVAFADSSSGGYWYGHSYGDNAEAVRNTAMGGCSAGAPKGTCRIKHVNCG
jgi:hypothetical protein